MADDPETTVPIVNGNGAQVAFLATQNTVSNAYTLQSTPRWNGAQVDTTNPLPVQNKPASLTLVPLDQAVVTTGGTAVQAINPGHRTAGGWIQNPSGGQPLGINEVGTAIGTTSAGNTVFIAAGALWQLAPSPNAVSVISTNSSHVFAGLGFM